MCHFRTSTQPAAREDMESNGMAVLGEVVGFGGLILIVAALLFGEAALATWFPRLKPPQRQRILSLVLLSGGFGIAAGLALSVTSTPRPPCPEDLSVADICVQ